MSDPDEVPVSGAGFGPEGGEQSGARPARPGPPRAPALGVDAGPPRSGEGEGGFPDAESEREVLEAGGPVLWGRVGRPGSPADHKGDGPAYASHVADESAADIVQQLADRDALGLRRNRSPEGGAAAASGGWAGLEAGPGGRGALALGRVESQPPSAAPPHVGGPEGGRAWGTPKRGAKSRSNVRVDRRRRSAAAKGPGVLPSDPESSDEFSEIQPMRVSIRSKEGGQAKPSSPEDRGDTPRHSNFHVRESFLHTLGSFLTSAPRGFTSLVERQAFGELDISRSKKMQSVVWGKGESRPSYQGAAAVAAAGGLPGATSRRKVAQEKKTLGEASKVASGKSFPSWGQRVSADPLEPATFPPISGVPLLGRSKSYALFPSGTKQSKHMGSRKKSAARRAREAELMAVAGEGSDSNRDAFPKGQRPGPSCLGMHRGECSRGDLYTRAPQVPGGSEPLAPSQGDVLPRVPAPSTLDMDFQQNRAFLLFSPVGPRCSSQGLAVAAALGESKPEPQSLGTTFKDGLPLGDKGGRAQRQGDLEPLDHTPRPERQQLPPAGAQGCPRCVVLQREIDDLKEQLAAMQSLTDKFQSL
ncbi:uncharacterized protein CXorf49 homolog [Ursus americanus]|uniref:uncharacterized protein CXorf49 homolog n=1 Tax=Ursus americanus TaxID=9643 RepID=UPI001E67DE8E|nr:uncharacterized protein CXorf49 homolog [Ursus americanus]